MRMSLAQLRQMRENSRQPSNVAAAPTIEPVDTIYYITAHITAAKNGGFAYLVAFGPNRSRSTAMDAMIHMFPRAESFFQGLGGPVTMDDRNMHLRWTEHNGDEVLVRMEHEHSPEVCACGQEQELFGIVHRVTDYTFAPISERAEIVG